MDFFASFCYTARQGRMGRGSVPLCNYPEPNAKGARVQVLVRDNNVDQALKALKKKMQREGMFREMKLRGHYEKPSEKKQGRRRKRSAAPASLRGSGCSARVCCR
jgi:ribosomal protein S21